MHYAVDQYYAANKTMMKESRYCSNVLSSFQSWSPVSFSFHYHRHHQLSTESLSRSARYFFLREFSSLRNSVINLWNSGSTERLSRSARYSILWEFSSLRNSASNLWNSGFFPNNVIVGQIWHINSTHQHTHIHTHTQAKQLEADIERLTSDKADLVTRLQCCEEDLKAANECEN